MQTYKNLWCDDLKNHLDFCCFSSGPVIVTKLNFYFEVRWRRHVNWNLIYLFLRKIISSILVFVRFKVLKKWHLIGTIITICSFSECWSIKLVVVDSSDRYIIEPQVHFTCAHAYVNKKSSIKLLSFFLSFFYFFFWRVENLKIEKKNVACSIYYVVNAGNQFASLSPLSFMGFLDTVSRAHTNTHTNYVRGYNVPPCCTKMRNYELKFLYVVWHLSINPPIARFSNRVVAYH